MPKIPFPRPVAIFVGLGFPREIDSVLEAYQLLNEWPQTTRGSKHLDALHNCAAVLGGRGSARDARRAFEAFAADRGILASDLLMSANRYATEWLGAARYNLAGTADGSAAMIRGNLRGQAVQFTAWAHSSGCPP